MKLVAGVLLALAAVAYGAIEDFELEDEVLVLTDNNFDAAVEEFNPLLVEFYAPWCGHCKRLAPEYADAAKALAGEGLRIAKVDATAQEALSKRFSIQGFPTLKFFKGDADPIDYSGGRTADAIASFVRKRSGPSYKTLETADDFAAFKDSSDVVVIGLFTSMDSDAAKVFTGIADSMDDTVFGASTLSAVRESAEVKGTDEAIVLFKRFDEGRADFKGDVGSVEEIKTFINGHSLPLVVEFNDENAPKIFGGDIHTHVLLFADSDSDDFDSLRAGWENVARGRRGEALFIHVSPNEDRILTYFDISPDDLPTVRLVNMPQGSAMKKYSQEDSSVVEEDIRSFVDDFFAGSLTAKLKSEEPEADDLSGDVVVVRGKTFKDIVLDPTKDVLLEFYAPWCGHCKALAPDYEKVGAHFNSVKDKVLVAKMDGTANEIDVEGVNVRGFPTLFFFPAGEDKTPVEYSGERSFKAISEFITENANNEFDVAEAGDRDEL